MKIGPDTDRLWIDFQDCPTSLPHLTTEEPEDPSQASDVDRQLDASGYFVELMLDIFKTLESPTGEAKGDKEMEAMNKRFNDKLSTVV